MNRHVVLATLEETAGSLVPYRSRLNVSDHRCRQERNYMSTVSEPLAGGPFAAEHYREGYELAAHELGDLTMSNVIG